MPERKSSMETTDATPADLKQLLRQQAEEKIWAKTPLTSVSVASLTPEETQQLLHELQVHQIELEMQNEALRQSQDALEESRARYFDLFDLAPVGYFSISPQGIIHEANLTAAILLGVTRNDLVKRPFTHFVLPPDQDNHYFHIKNLADTSIPQTYELRLKRPNNASLWVRVYVIKVSDGQHYRLVITDINERKVAERALQVAQTQLVQQERLAAVGQLAAGIAHDFNNILAVINLYLELALQTNDLTQIKEKLKAVLNQSEHATSLVQQILDFGRRAIIQPQPLDLASFLPDQVKILQRTIPENIQINLTISNEPCIVSVDPTRFQQLITNLTLNARDVMPIGGQLIMQVTMRHFTSDEDTPLVDMPTGNWVQITIQDTGDGIDPEVLPHIFEPFFTTKETGKGTGLGLAQVYGIVKQHNGYIDVHSAVGQGATFVIYLPVLARNGNIFAPSQPEKLLKGNGETVLIVEDNDALRDGLVTSLENINYRTRSAANGIEALALLENPSQNIAVVLSDMVMPELGGDALFEAIQIRGLNVPVIVLSGHPLEAAFIEILKAKGLAGFLMKPPDIKSLARLIAQALQREK